MSAISPEFIPVNPAPKVTVCVVAYNQKDFIAQCLQSLVDQQTDFPFEILVADDCSTDGTSEIVESFVGRYPGRVVHWRHEANVGAYQNYIWIHAQAAKRGGSYIAHMDGDDSALPGKLQAQVETLDRHPEIALSAHAVRVMGRSTKIGDKFNLPERVGVVQLLDLGAYFVNSSTMYRAVNHVPRVAGQDVVDFYHYVEQASRGEIHLNKEILGEYRWHQGGISKNPAHRARIEVSYEAAFDLALSFGVPPIDVRRSRLKRRMSFALASLVDRQVDEFRNKIRLTGVDWFFASMKHRALASGRFFIRGVLVELLIRRLTGM